MWCVHKIPIHINELDFRIEIPNDMTTQAARTVRRTYLCSENRLESLGSRCWMRKKCKKKSYKFSICIEVSWACWVFDVNTRYIEFRFAVTHRRSVKIFSISTRSLELILFINGMKLEITFQFQCLQIAKSLQSECEMWIVKCVICMYACRRTNEENRN